MWDANCIFANTIATAFPLLLHPKDGKVSLMLIFILKCSILMICIFLIFLYNALVVVVSSFGNFILKQGSATRGPRLQLVLKYRIPHYVS